MTLLKFHPDSYSSPNSSQFLFKKTPKNTEIFENFLNNHYNSKNNAKSTFQKQKSVKYSSRPLVIFCEIIWYSTLVFKREDENDTQKEKTKCVQERKDTYVTHPTCTFSLTLAYLIFCIGALYFHNFCGSKIIQ